LSNVDLRKIYEEHYKTSKEPVVVDVPLRPYIMIDGKGDPDTAAAYREALETLYPLAYGLRKAVKDATGTAYKVMPLEGLWWLEDMRRFSVEDKSNWLWTAMICLPGDVTEEMVAEVLPAVTAKKKLPSGHLARVERFGDGKAAQILHLGPYSDEAPTIERLHGYIDDEGCKFNGKHHEIYLTDPRKSKPSKNRTIIRQPIRDNS
jgi:hypothetical protein